MIRFDGPGVIGNDDADAHRVARQLNRVADEGLSLVRALEALEAEIALTRDAPPDVLALGTRAAELRKDLDFLLRADDTGFVYYLDDPRPRRVPARVADRRLSDRRAICCSTE